MQRTGKFYKKLGFPDGPTNPENKFVEDGDVFYNTTTKLPYYRKDGAWEAFGTGGSGASTFLQLTDTPANYVGASGYTVRVNATEDALEFVNVTTGVSTLVGLSDTPSTYVGASGYYVKVNDTEDGVDFVSENLATVAYVNNLVIPVDYVPDSINVATGTQDAGDVASLQTLDDGDTLDVSEVTGVPGFNIEIDFASVVETPTRLDIHAHYDATAGHTVNVQIYDQVGLSWDTLGTLPEGTDFEYFTYDIVNGAKYIDGSNAVETRIYHASSGNINHDIYVDYVALRKIPTGGGAGVTDHGQLAGLGDDDHPIYLHKDGSEVGATVTSQQFAIGINTDLINEYTAGSGVLIDGVLIKDGTVDGKDIGNLGFIDLEDTPSTYTSTNSEYVRIKSDETGLEFANPPDWTSIIIVDANGKGDYTTISAAITAAATGDTILVMPGEYSENLTFSTTSKDLSVIGLTAGWGEEAETGVTISGNATSYTVQISAVTAHIRLQNLTITNEYSNSSATIWAVYNGSSSATLEMWNCKLRAKNTAPDGYDIGVECGSGSITAWSCDIVAEGVFDGRAAKVSLAGAVLALNNCVLDGSTSDAIQTGGTLSLNHCTLVNNTLSGTITYANANTDLRALLTVDGTGSGLDADKVDNIEGAELLQRGGSVALTANWDAGGYEIRALKLYADQATGTAPFTVVSTTLVSNLNADYLDNQHGSYYLPASTYTTHAASDTAHSIEYTWWFGQYTALLSGRSTTPIYDTLTIPYAATANSFGCLFRVATTNNGSNYWTFTVYRVSDAAALGSFNSSAQSPDTWVRMEDTTLSNNSLTTAHRGLYFTIAKVGSPGPINMYNPYVIVTK